LFWYSSLTVKDWMPDRLGLALQTKEKRPKKKRIVKSQLGEGGGRPWDQKSDGYTNTATKHFDKKIPAGKQIGNGGTMS